ncbi:hypothetical protein ACFX1S_040382 [Malus domestica]
MADQTKSDEQKKNGLDLTNEGDQKTPLDSRTNRILRLRGGTFGRPMISPRSGCYNRKGMRDLAKSGKGEAIALGFGWQGSVMESWVWVCRRRWGERFLVRCGEGVGKGGAGKGGGGEERSWDGREEESISTFDVVKVGNEYGRHHIIVRSYLDPYPNRYGGLKLN